MNVIERTVAVAVDLLPADEVRQALLPPVRALREVAVSVAATVRHWELALEGGHDDPVIPDAEHVARPPARDGASEQVVDVATVEGLAEVEDEVWDDIGGAPVTSLAEDTVEVPSVGVPAEEGDPQDLPVEDWPELSFADAQARLHDLGTQDLRTLIAYETQHGHRLQYTLLLEQRLSSLTSSVDD